MTYHGSLGDWTGAPAADPRMIRRYATVKATYRVRGVSAANAPRAVALLNNEARRRFSGGVRNARWNADGSVGFEISLSTDTRAGEVKRKLFEIGQVVGPQIQNGASIYDAKTIISPSDIAETAPVTTQDGSTVLAPESETSGPAEPFYMKTVLGLPVWGLGLGVVTLGAVGFFFMRRRKRATTSATSAVTANARRGGHNDEERRQWAENDEGLYDDARRYRGGIAAYVRAHRQEIDDVIDNVVSGRRPAHYLKYGPRPNGWRRSSRSRRSRSRKWWRRAA